MKTIAILFVSLFFSIHNYSQNAESVDSVSTAQTKKEDIKIRSHRTIRQSEDPLFVVDGVPVAAGDEFVNSLNPEDIKSTQILRNTSMFSCYSSNTVNDVILISTKENTPVIKNEVYSFKTYKICNNNWNLHQDVYNDIQAKVPSVSITTTADLNAIPKISMRGDANTIVIVDGIRYDASVLNTLNPTDIESITVAPSAAAANYLRNN